MKRLKLNNPPETLCETDAKWLEEHNVVTIKDDEVVWILNSELTEKLQKESIKV